MFAFISAYKQTVDYESDGNKIYNLGARKGSQSLWIGLEGWK